MRYGAFTKIDQCIFNISYQEPLNSTNDELFENILKIVDLRLKSFTEFEKMTNEHRQIFEESKKATSYDHFLKEYLYENYPGYGPVKLKKLN